MMLERAERFLMEMPGKFSLLVGNVPDSLSFERAGGEWGLYYGHHVEHVSEDESLLHPLKHVTTADVATKAKAAILLPGLFKQILDTSSSLLRDVNQGLKALESIQFLKGDR